MTLVVVALLVAVLLVAQWWACRKPKPAPQMPDDWTYEEPEEPNNDAFMLGVRIAFWGSLFDDSDDPI